MIGLIHALIVSLALIRDILVYIMIPFDSYIKSIEEARGECLEADERTMLLDAFEIASTYHSGQKRANGDDYFEGHCVPVSLKVALLNMETSMIAAALLHDSLEDTSLTYDELVERCGIDIADMVDGVSKLSKVKYKGNDRHLESLRKFFVAIAKDARVVILKVCDRWHNLETLEYLAPEKRQRIAQESIVIHAQLASRLGMGKLASILKDLAFPYAYPEDYEKTVTFLSEALKLAQTTVDEMYDELVPLCSQLLGYNPEIDKRVKGVYSSFKKLQRKDWQIGELYDLVALRVIVKNIDDSYRILGAIHTKWHPIPGRLKDYIAIPKPNGYRSLHTSVISRSGLIVEIQIRTNAMHNFNEYGIASHHSYKNHGQGESRESFEWISQLGSLEDEKLTPEEYIRELRSDFFQDRIFALTPKGDVIDLPVGATILDFAYALHSDIGDSAQGGRINGKFTSLNTEIPSESIIEIVVSSRNKPSDKWLEWAKTNHARSKIKRRLSAQRR